MKTYIQFFKVDKRIEEQEQSILYLEVFHFFFYYYIILQNTYKNFNSIFTLILIAPFLQHSLHSHITFSMIRNVLLVFGHETDDKKATKDLCILKTNL